MCTYSDEAKAETTKINVMDYLDIKSYIFFKRLDIDGAKWQILTHFGIPCTDLQTGIETVRSGYKALGITPIGLASFEQMLLNNTDWDNL